MTQEPDVIELTGDQIDLERQAEAYLVNAIESIDKHLGEGYARAHSELIGAYMQTVVIANVGDQLDRIACGVLDVADQYIYPAPRQHPRC